jgi:SAM-dependent methyltransferase
MRKDPYDIFARFYDAWQAGYPKPFARAILPFYERELMRRSVPERSLADLACGTGTFLEAWAARHEDWSMTGVDQSKGMLRAARKNLKRSHVSAKLLHQPLQELDLRHPVGAAICVFDSLNHLTRLSDLRGAFRATAGSLHPGGLFIFDINDERAFPRLFQGSWTVESTGLFVSVIATCREDGLRGSLRYTVFERRRGSWSRSDFSIEERNWLRGEVEEALDRAGFTILRVRRIQPYPPSEIEAPRTLWVCRLHRHRSSGTSSFANT